MVYPAKTSIAATALTDMANEPLLTGEWYENLRRKLQEDFKDIFLPAGGVQALQTTLVFGLAGLILTAFFGVLTAIVLGKIHL